MSLNPRCTHCGADDYLGHTCPDSLTFETPAGAGGARLFNGGNPMPSINDQSDEMPPDPIGQMAEDANTLHEMFMSYVAAGFSDDQAMRIVLQTHQTLLQMKIGLMLSQGYNPFESGR